MNKVQEALKAAIEELEAQGIFSTADLCKSALAEIGKCEPVAEVRLSVTGRKELFLPSFNAIFANFGTGVGQGFEVGTKLYTSPISKEWVGLSDQQIQNLIINSDNYNKFQFIKSVEHTVKQLNAPDKG
jgi:hypothetical protein